MAYKDAVTIREAASRLRVHENTIRNWIESDIIYCFELPTGIRRVPESEVRRLEQQMFAVPDSFPEKEWVTTDAPKPLTVDEPPAGSYPDS